MEIFVGNLSFDSSEADLKKLFEDFGNVASVVILRRKEKKEPKSRGFGFVGMPDEQQALAAIAGTNGKEFMGRALSVEPARPKVEANAQSKPKKEREPKPRVFKVPRPNGRAGTPPSAVDRRVRLFKQHLALSDGKCALSGQPQPGSYKGGRRSISYMKRHGPAAIKQETNPRQRNQENPMRWRKRADQPRPWQKSTGEHKPGKKTDSQFKPWKKTEDQSKPWQKSTGEHKPEKKTDSQFKPWKKTEGQSKPWKKTEGQSKPWQKSTGEHKPGKKTDSQFKPWKKTEGQSKSWKKRK